ncbi:hypothetical protein CIK76_10490 [Glutamicibacter sp. BW80]|nr:hypothetical protein CIK76_10490 [Glutamicibacter sp. BW80]
MQSKGQIMTGEAHASEEYEARLEASADSPLKAAGRWAAAIASATLGDAEFEARGAEVVVHSLKNDAILLRMQTSNLEEAERLIVQIRKDLEELSTAEFVEEWGQGNTGGGKHLSE